MTSFIRCLTFYGLSLFSVMSPGQSTNDIVRWEFTARHTAKDAAVLSFLATIAPGWHLYSQRIEEGGPPSTEFRFESSNKFVLDGKAEENGEPVTFHDTINEMDVTWYSGSVNFLQRIQITTPEASVKGTIEFIVCNDHTCIPDKVNFRFDL